MARDWGGYGALLKEARALQAAEAAKPLISCPVCGNKLDVNARGEKSCDVGHFRTGMSA